jgi:hypothetical protein
MLVLWKIMTKFNLSIKYHLIDKFDRYVLLLNMPAVQAISENGFAASGAGDHGPVGTAVESHAAAPKGFPPDVWKLTSISAQRYR